MEFITVREKGVTTSCEVVHRFTDIRAIVLWDGLYLLADRLSPSEWELSSVPASPGAESMTLTLLVKRLEARGVQVTVTKLEPDGS